MREVGIAELLSFLCGFAAYRSLITSKLSAIPTPP